MIYLLFIFLIIMFIVSYYFTGRDLFAPSTVQILTFVGSVLMCIYYMLSLNISYKFHWETIGMIASAMFLTSIIGLVIHFLFIKMKIQASTPENVTITPISGTMYVLLVGIVLLTIGWLMIEIRRIGGTRGSFTQIMFRFHDNHSYSTAAGWRMPWLLNQLISLLSVFMLILAFNLIRFFDTLTLGQKCINFFVFGLCGLGSLLTGLRTGLVNQLICCFMLFHLLRIQKMGRFKQYRLKALIRIALLVIFVLGGFFAVKSFVGRTGKSTTLNPVDYIAHYTGSQYIALDLYLQQPPSPSKIFGKETFYNLIRFLIEYKFIDIPPYLGHLEFRPVGAGFSNNVYTFLRSYHYDFGFIGMLILHSFSILLLSLFYEYVKKRRGNLSIMIFSQIYYTVVMSFFTERFYSNLFSVNYIKQLFMMLVLYELLIRKRIRFVICRRKEQRRNPNHTQGLTDG